MAATTTITTHTATEPGALDGFAVTCTCGDRSTHSLHTVAVSHAIAHERWHARSGR